MFLTNFITNNLVFEFMTGGWQCKVSWKISFVATVVILSLCLGIKILMSMFKKESA